ncbi:hypothetical protein [Acholeplasma laidlawii]|uniref:EAL domain-containing protein n=1 Tax=Acholeplasma laidlawii TaxID=2148 RepID=A0A553IGY8_ACHLA|nr:hypothetical protein [Acholeplasma laidlawii]NWH09697.1 hypothetical protein [Acholeplasma laidlawii]NWH11087.1 hypothetical protein [Acholeplasma laidlawii]NWH13502.1 hypothetical protein [Acholeplasma laidlawii]NWH14519.1 hypothetical protein [Acholeplasma laidlawii]OAN19728.1 hypothetical protein A2I99_04855 [Acholeplasma laidlawii]
MNELQKSLISLGAIIIVLVLVYLSIHYYLKSLKKMKKHKMLTLNLVIKYKLFLEYLAYQEKKNHTFYLYLVKINNLSLVEHTYSDHTVRNYLTHIAKELSVYLPFCGKLAQTNQRDTFIVYYPSMDEDKELLGKQFKLLAQKTYHENGIHITKTASVATIDSFDLKALSSTLISSIKHLGAVTSHDDMVKEDYETYADLINKLKQVELELKTYQVETLKIKKTNEVFNELLINGSKLDVFLNKLPVSDMSWVNMMLVEMILNKLYHENIYANINIPVLLSTLEQETFIEYLQTIVKANQFLLENVILSIRLSNVTYEDELIKNILTLSNLGVKMSMHVDEIHQGLYLALQRYHIKRLEIDDKVMEHDMIAELLYFAKVNHIEVLYKTEKSIQDGSLLNVSHITKERLQFKADKQKRGRR